MCALDGGGGATAKSAGPRPAEFRRPQCTPCLADDLPPADDPSRMTLVAIAPPEYDVELQLAYATADNFTGRPVYGRAAAYLHPIAAAHLKRAIEGAAALGLRLVIFDAFRPSEAQWAL
jgi:D-alanyl-D-alanine dipeptidase